MRRFLLPLVWPTVAGVLVAIVLLIAFPKLSGQAPSVSPPAASPQPITIPESVERVLNLKTASLGTQMET